jgi:hypothetical protein
MSTYAILKRKLANQLGRTDNATANTIRDNSLNDAYNQICNDNKFSWLIKKTTITVASGVANLPSDYNPQYGLFAAYSQTGTANDKSYERVDVRELDNFSSSDRVYYISYNSTTNYYVFNGNNDETVTIYYYYIPAELSADADVCVVPDDSAVVYLATAKWWLAKERDEANYDRFYGKYAERLLKMMSNDKTNNTYRRLLASKLDDSQGESILMTQR